MRKLTITHEAKGRWISSSNFASYDACLNPYVGCAFGCSACYVRFFIKSDLPWGEWTKVRKMQVNLHKDLIRVGSTRLVLGTMCDPYAPIELKERNTRTALQIILGKIPGPKDSFGFPLKVPKMKKVGIFTRSPLVLQDIDLIKQLPRGRVHFTVSPFDQATIKVLEPIPIHNKVRWDVIRKLKAAGIRVHVSIAPAIPIVSDALIDQFAAEMASIGVDEFFTDSLQTYTESFIKVEEALSGHPEWATIRETMQNKNKYSEWKKQFRDKWTVAWKKVAHLSPNTMPIGSDHETKSKINLLTGEPVDWENYDKYENTLEQTIRAGQNT